MAFLALYRGGASDLAPTTPALFSRGAISEGFLRREESRLAMTARATGGKRGGAPAGPRILGWKLP